MEIRNDIDFLVIVGPTASGKTALSLKLAKQYNGEIINGDSVQVYKGLDIGSAKIKKKEMEGIKHHLLDIISPDEEYSVSNFKRDCEEKIEHIKSKGKLPIIVGGTGLYISSIVYDYKLVENGIDEQLKNEISTYNNNELYEIVSLKCEEYGIEIHVNNRQRLLGYAYKILKGIPLKEERKTLKNCQILCIDIERKVLYDRINKRVDEMIEEGLLDEVKKFPRNYPSQTAIGYKEVHMYFAGEYDYTTMVDKIKQHTRNFAKRQYTWFKNQMNVDLVKLD